MGLKNKTPGAAGTAQGAKDTATSSPNDSLLRAFIQRSRFHSSIVVADRHAFGALGRTIESRDALAVLKAARGVGAAYVVLAGQLHRAKAPCVGFIIKDADNVGLLETAYIMAFDRLTELGESDSLNVVAIRDAEVRGRLERRLAELSTVEGTT
jgi:hypothetical protein